jgi:hypothetical protein
MGSMFELHCLRDGADGNGEKIQFWVYLSDWDFQVNAITVMDSEHISDSNRETLKRLVGVKLIKIEYFENLNQIKFVFEDKKTLTVNGNTAEYDPDDDMLRVYLDGVITVSCNPLNKLYWDKPTVEH